MPNNLRRLSQYLGFKVALRLGVSLDFVFPDALAAPIKRWAYLVEAGVYVHDL